jgi:hypothetical protein
MDKRRIIGMITGLVLAASGCGGGEAPPPAPRRPSGEDGPARGGGGGSSVGGPAQKVQALTLYPKVDDQYRREFTKEDFLPDSIGDRNRDPFRSYFIEPSTGTGSVVGANEPREDYCEKRTVAPKFGFRDLTLIGVLSGKRKGALFVDTQKFGHIARLGDCLSKDKVRLTKIEGSTVEVEIRGEAPPGGAAPPPRREVVPLYREEIERSEFGNEPE